MDVVIRIFVWILDVYSLLIFVCLIMQGTAASRHRHAAILSNFVDPFLAPLRRILPTINGWDISGVTAIVILQFISRSLS